MESSDSVQGLLALGESLPKRPRAAEVVFEEEDLGSGEFELIYDRMDQILQENEDLRETIHRLDNAVKNERYVSAQLEGAVRKLQAQLQETMRRVVALERPE
jgi:hypothetical protein